MNRSAEPLLGADLCLIKMPSRVSALRGGDAYPTVASHLRIDAGSSLNINEPGTM